MVKTVITNSPVQPDFFNNLNNPRFNRNEAEEEFDGQHKRIRDDSLSNDPTQIKARVYNFFDEFKVSAGSGLAVNYQGGIITLPGGNQLTVASGTLALTNNATNYIYINQSGVVVASTADLPNRFMMAEVVTAAGVISGSVIDRRKRFTVEPIGKIIKLFGGSGDQGDKVVSGSETFSGGRYYFRNLTVTSTGVLTIDRSAEIFCSGNVLIQGSIVVTQAVEGGISSRLSTAASTATGGQPGAGIAPGSGVGAGLAYNFTTSKLGSGGGQGRIVAGGAIGDGNLSSGGRGGGFLQIEAAGTITIAATAVITAIGGNAVAGIQQGGSPNLPGGGGGSGGLLLFASLIAIIIAAGATLDVRGGNGAPGVGSGSGGGGGGGGGNGVLIAPTVTNAGTVNRSGGTAGADSGTVTHAGAGGGAFGGNGGIGSTAGSLGQLVILNFVPVA